MNRVIVVLVCCGLAVTPVIAQDLVKVEDDERQPEPPAIVAQIEATIAEGVGKDGLAKQLASAGSSIVPGLFEALGPMSPLRDDIRREVEKALKLIGPGPVFTHIRSIFDGEPDLELRMRSLRVVGVVGGRGAWSITQQLLTGVHEHSLRSAAVSGNIRKAVERAVASDPDAPLSIARSWSSLDDSWRPSILRALAESGTKRSTALLIRLADTDKNHRAAALAALVKVPALAIHRLDPPSWRRLRVRISSPDPAVRRLAVTIVARGHDVRAFTDVIDLLRDKHPLVRKVAAQALHVMTGVRAAADGKRWRSWYRVEQEWRDDRSEVELSVLQSSNPQAVTATLSSLRQHRLFRDVFLSDVHAVLRHDEAVVRESACKTLAALGSPRSANALVGLLEDPVDRVRRAAHDALRAVTGLRHGPDRKTWRAALRPR